MNATLGAANVSTWAQVEARRHELTGFCYRMLGSATEAEDAVQETLLRAWRARDRFEGRASVRTWVYRIATNVCLDALGGRDRRARPMDLGPSSTVVEARLTPRAETTWVEPVPDARVLHVEADPADVAIARESIRLAFVAALQVLAPRQRVVLILRDVLRWQAAEVATLLDSSVPAVNSALQRARAVLAQQDPDETEVFDPLDATQVALLARYVDAFERYDLDALTALLREDAIQSMPPYDLWLRGHAQIRAWLAGPGAECSGSRLVATAASGSPAFGQYRPSGPGGRHEPWALQVVEVSAGRVVAMNAYLDTARLFPLFGLPARLDQ